MKKLVITIIATVCLPAVATLSATAQLAPSHQYAQLQRATAQAAGELAMDAVPNLNPDNIRQVQQALQKKGFNPGPIDGVLGPQTEEAVRDFQDRYGMKASGKLDNQTLYALGEVGLSGQAGSASNTGR